MSLKAQDIRGMSDQEIELKIESMREEIFRLTYEAKTGRVDKPHKLREMRRDIARCETILREKEIEKRES